MTEQPDDPATESLSPLDSVPLEDIAPATVFDARWE
ncbi:hypothetical protein JOF56_007614 [Kibdelosporangium banguiense]|uniref:Uncharacterized protein n=1 Tax=Kibdelosporangium banguiense TaxID=1365924 RepID=A0ABS4TS35_9PSEU|nr:hypothetical protein [Kibdelosporangium banguiense]